MQLVHPVHRSEAPNAQHAAELRRQHEQFERRGAHAHNRRALKGATMRVISRRRQRRRVRRFLAHWCQSYESALLAA
jgi:hypothetical protein